MAKYRDTEFPNDCFMETVLTVNRQGYAITAASRFEGKRNFERIVVEVSRDDAIKMARKILSDFNVEE